MDLNTHTAPAQKADGTFSRWWIIAAAFVFIYGTALLIIITCKAYDDKPPVPALVVDEAGQTLFTGKDVTDGQQVFLRYGLMDNGSFWGHGAYLGPDFTAAYLHDVALNYKKVNPGMPQSEITAMAKRNRYDADGDMLVMDGAQALTFSEAPAKWGEYLSKPVNNGGLKADLISNPEELRQLAAFFAWGAWASSALRPGADVTYTNNFPYEPDLGMGPSTAAIVWSAASLFFLLVGIGACMAFNGRVKRVEWGPSSSPVKPYMLYGSGLRSVRTLVKFTVIVGLLFLTQTLVGGGVAHYRADPGSFYGLDLSVIFPSQLLRTWHLQLAILWIATGFVVGGLIISRVLGGKDWRGLVTCLNVIFVAFGAVIFGSLLAEWAGLAGWWDDATFWLGSQGWEYLEIGRAWQYLMIVGFLFWAAVIIRNTLPALRDGAKGGRRPLAIIFLICAIAVPVFYLPAIFYDGATNYTVVDTWRFWVIHLWVEGFFETFATAMVAMVFVELGFVTRTFALRIIFLDIILTLMGGIVGTGHHMYFDGNTDFNMALSACFSAMEVVPLVLLTLEGWRFDRTARTGGVSDFAYQNRWTLNYFMAVGFWNFMGAGVFGFLINMPVISYFEIGTQLTPNHGHAALFGVFGFLALGLSVYAMRRALTDAQWLKIVPLLKCSFWGLNIGLALMLALSLLPGGFTQLCDVINNGYWHARSIEFNSSPMMSTIGWMRMPGDVIFIIFGAFPFFLATLRAFWIVLRTRKLAYSK